MTYSSLFVFPGKEKGEEIDKRCQERASGVSTLCYSQVGSQTSHSFPFRILLFHHEVLRERPTGDDEIDLLWHRAIEASIRSLQAPSVDAVDHDVQDESG